MSEKPSEKKGSFAVSHPVNHGFRVLEPGRGSAAADVAAREALAAARERSAAREAAKEQRKAARPPCDLAGDLGAKRGRKGTWPARLAQFALRA
jgi:hypothetical protein